MRIIIAALIILSGCAEPVKESGSEQTATNISSSSVEKKDSPDVGNNIRDTAIQPSPPKADTHSSGKLVYGNKRFRNVTILNTGNGNYDIQGEGQIFEANFSWVIEDGHNEIKKGYEMTDAGAPEWGKFHFTVNVRKKPNSTLHLILFEISAKDGSRQHELPIPLP